MAQYLYDPNLLLQYFFVIETFPALTELRKIILEYMPSDTGKSMIFIIQLKLKNWVKLTKSWYAPF